MDTTSEPGGYKVGGIPGRDSVPAMLTPGEYLITKQQQLALLRCLGEPLDLEQVDGES